MSFGDIVDFSSVKNFVIVELKINNISSQILLSFFFFGDQRVNFGSGKGRFIFMNWRASSYFCKRIGV